MVYNIYHYDNKNIWTSIRVENDSLITGYRQTKGWARDRKVFFAIQFSKPFKSYGHKKYDKLKYDGFYRRFNQEENFPEMAGKNLRAYFNFDTQDNEKIKVKVALSSVSTAGALKNLTADEDVDGQYRGLDQNIHKSKGFTNYTIFSLWDTYRALHPLFNITQPARNNDMIKSMLAHHDQSVHNMLPVWSHYANENWCMIGYHAVSVIADAMVKNVGDFDKERALHACVNTANVRYFDGLGDYIDFHYVPDDKSHSSVSKTLEYAYNDWCIAQIAKKLGKKDIKKVFTERAKYYKNVYDTSINFMRPKLADGSFRQKFDPMDTHGQGFIEGNAWNYGLYVPQDLNNMVQMMGGKQRMSKHLDSLFNMEIEDKYISKHEDITRDGIIGNYVHGNEPGHHIPYLYNWTGEAEKTQARVRMILDSMYGADIDGLCGNDDAGQMSAWYVFSSLGFYPVTPGSEVYAIGSPLVKNAKIHLSSGRIFSIEVRNQSAENVYVKNVTLNGKPINNMQLPYRDIINGSELVFEMSP